MTDSIHDIELSAPTDTIRPPIDQVSSVTVESPNGIEQPSLPPADQGRDAWLALAGCSFIQAPVWGMPEFIWMVLTALNLMNHRLSSVLRGISRILHGS